MWRKDFQRTLWVPGLSLLFALTAWLVSAAGWTFRDFRTPDLLEVLFHGGLVLVLPLLSFLAGLTLVQQEHWALVWTFPVGRGRVLAGKLLAGWLQVLLGGGLMVFLFRLFFHPPASDTLGILMVIGLALAAFLLGVLAGLGAPSTGAAVLLLLGALIVAAVAGRWSGLSWALGMSLHVLGQEVAIFLAAVLILGIAVALAGLYRAHRMFRPWRNGALAFALLAGLPLAVLLLNAALLRYATTVSDLDDVRPFRLRLVNERTILVEGATRKLGWLESLDTWTGGSRFRRGGGIGVLGRLDSRRAIQITRYDWIHHAVPSDDGAYVLLLVGEWQEGGWSFVVRAVDAAGRTAWRFPLGTADYRAVAGPFWRPDSHEVHLVTGSALLRVDLDSRRQVSLPLPSELPPFRLSKDFEYHAAMYLEDGTLTYLRHSGPRGYQVFACRPGGHTWELAMEERALPDETNTPAYGYGRWPTVFTYGSEWRVLYAAGGRVRAVAVPRGALVAVTREGLLLHRDDALWRRGWDAPADERLRDFPFDVGEGFSDGTRVFLLARKPGRTDSESRLRLFILDTPAGAPREIGVPLKESLSGSLLDSHGPLGLINCWNGSDSWTGLVDLRTGKLQKVSAQIEWY
jgi:uncharacterized membrane protein YidH (DUF202 family)